MKTTFIPSILVAAGLTFGPPPASAQEHGRHGDPEVAAAPCPRAGEDASMGSGMMDMQDAMTGMGMMGMMGMMEPGAGGTMMGRGGAMSPGMMWGDMMFAQTGARSPRALLRQKEALDLSDDQVRRLQRLDDELSRARSEHLEGMRDVHGELAELRADEADRVDVSRYEGLLRRMAETAVKMHVQAARVGNEAVAVLTAEQRSKVRYGLELMRGMRGEMRTLAPQGCRP